MRVRGFRFGLAAALLAVSSLAFAPAAFCDDSDATYNDVRPARHFVNTHTLPLSLSTGVTFSPNINGLVMVPLVISYVGPTAPGENPFVSYIDQPIIGKTTEPLVLQTGKVVPTGTVFAGTVVHIVPPRRLVRNGYAIVHFDSIVHDNGQVIPINSTGTPPRNWRSDMVQRGNIVANSALSGALGGAIVGAGVVVGMLLSNPEAVIPAFLIGFGGGPAAGALVGAAVGLTKRGEDARSTLGRPVVIPVPAEALLKASVDWDIEQEVDDAVVFKSVRTQGLTEPYRLQVEAVVANESDEILESSDLVLENQLGDHFPIYFDNKHNTPTNFSVPPHSVRRFFVNFEPDAPHTSFKLVWYRHLSSLKVPLVEFKLQ